MSENSEIGETKSLSTPRIASMMFLAFIEAFLFGYILDGWPAIEYMLRSDGVYSNLCSGISTDNQSNIKSTWRSLPTQRNQFSYDIPNSEKETCVEQDTIFNTAYMIANTLGLGSAWLLGYFFDRFGLLISRIISAICLIVGLLMLSFKDIALSWLIFPSSFLIALGGVMVVITTTHVALLAGSKKATCIAIISACLDVSAIMTSFMQAAFDAGITRDMCMYCYAGLLLIHILNTICLSPKNKVYDEAPGELKTEESDVKKAYPIVISLTVATLSSVALSISSLFWKYSVVYASSIFAVILKGTMYATHVSFTQIVYPVEHQGKALGAAATVASLFNLLEEPLFVWAESSQAPFRGVTFSFIPGSYYTSSSLYLGSVISSIHIDYEQKAFIESNLANE
ncbi:hypothetical protein LSH36_1850g00012 [Paralvinella palmiformis]|uniref:Uncharacterized protein n=1 Tax=Paralvinella palmiformis TaxID=53620 RepID=A0AAD9IR70_9ANNE|nr:hypothetical protein LSH36_1850g00012 [Paralvinella palmiformis]